jgi:predicted Zn-dependent protease
LGALAAFLFLRPGWEATNLNQFLFVLDCFFGGGAMNSIRSIAFLAGAGLLAVCLSASAQTATQPTRAAAEKDPVLKAMLEELDRSKSQLQLQGFEKPFFIQYRIEDVDDFTTRSAFGASVHSQRSHQRIAFITVRVGDNKTDSSSGRNDGALAMVNLDDDPIAIRSALWQGTDQAYKNALKAYAQKQAALKQVETPPLADDFSREKPLVSLAAPLSLKLDEQAWTDRVARDSGLYRTNVSVKDGQNNVQYSFAQFSARVTTTWLATSEGSIVRKPEARYEESFEVGTQAADGMRLERSYSTTGNSLKELDSPEAFDQRAVALIASLTDLRKAPVVEEEYHGPVLLSADASTGIAASLLSGAVTATRPRLGTEARTNGLFASSYHTRVLPESLDVVDDPGLKTFAGKGLLGAYDVDDEGVPAQAVKLISAGRLENFLIGREPVRDFPQSNGHGRAGVASAPRPSIGVLELTTKNGLTDEELNRKLMDLAKDRGLKSAYYVETLGGKMAPRLLYRVSLDGKRELVRGAALADLDQRALRSSVEAAGKELFVMNISGDVPATVLAPALLVDDVTVKRANEKNDKLPFYPPPE